jgi:membrane-associated protease RseP (regulator of RpoE activity)
MLTTLAILLGLGLLIGLHEAAHMTIAKLFGVKVNKFSLGFGPLLFSKQFGETAYELRVLPLGGFVLFHGECPESRVKRGFFSISWWKRSLVALAGPVMNLILGFLILLFVVMALKGYPLKEGTSKAFEVGSYVVTQTLGWIGHSVVGKASIKDVSGPVMVTKIMVDAFKIGMDQFLFILAVISLSLGLFNLLPVPGLDGGHIALYSVEGIIRKPLSGKVYAIWSRLGMVLLIGLMGFVVFSDLIKLLIK